MNWTWFNNLDSTTRALLITILNIVIATAWTEIRQTGPAPIVVPPAAVTVQPAPGAPMVAAPTPAQK